MTLKLRFKIIDKTEKRSQNIKFAPKTKIWDFTTKNFPLPLKNFSVQFFLNSVPFVFLIIHVFFRDLECCKCTNSSSVQCTADCTLWCTVYSTPVFKSDIFKEENHLYKHEKYLFDFWLSGFVFSQLQVY